VTAEPVDVGASRMLIRQHITRDGELLFDAMVTVAFIAADLSGPRRMPKAMRELLKSHVRRTAPDETNAPNA